MYYRLGPNDRRWPLVTLGVLFAQIDLCIVHRFSRNRENLPCTDLLTHGFCQIESDNLQCCEHPVLYTIATCTWLLNVGVVSDVHRASQISQNADINKEWSSCSSSDQRHCCLNVGESAFFSYHVQGTGGASTVVWRMWCLIYQRLHIASKQQFSSFNHGTRSKLS